MRQALRQGLGELRYEPTEKRVRAVLGDRTVVDSTRAVLVWEPRRVVPSYAVPADDVHAELAPVDSQAADDRPILDPRVPFAAHSTAGQAFDVVVWRQEPCGRGVHARRPGPARSRRARFLRLRHVVRGG